eukprot:g3456.t1
MDKSVVDEELKLFEEFQRLQNAEGKEKLQLEKKFDQKKTKVETLVKELHHEKEKERRKSIKTFPKLKHSSTGSIKSGYLLTYNLWSALGWAYVGYLLIIVHWRASDFWNPTRGKVFEAIWPTLFVVQSCAALEIVHAGVGLVRAPFVTTFIQVSSRLICLWVTLFNSPPARKHWSLTLMVASWSLVEVPRYLFYAANELTPGKSENVWYPLLWIRYTAFMVLYPTGITGEMFQLWVSLPYWYGHTLNAAGLTSTSGGVKTAVGAGSSWFNIASSGGKAAEAAASNLSYEFLFRFMSILFLVYFVAGPFMISVMLANRRRVFRNVKRALNPRPLRGLLWPITNDLTKERSSTRINKRIFSGSVEPIDEESSDSILKEKNWRFGYVKHVNRNVQLSAQSSSNALRIATQGLATAHSVFQFVDDNGNTTTFAEAMETVIERVKTKGAAATKLFTGRVIGELEKPKRFELEIPYQKGASGNPYYEFQEKTPLKGLDLLKQLDKWEAYGVVEGSAAEAIKSVAQHPSWLDLSNHTFILLGAGSAMGPLEVLLRHGAHVVAVDLNGRAQLWTRLLHLAKNSCGSMTFPLQICSEYDDISGERRRVDRSNDLEWLAKNAGADLLQQTPDIADWLCRGGLQSGSGRPVPKGDAKVIPSGKPVTIGNYTYLDGALHVQLSLACDGIIEVLCNHRPDLAVAFLCTPTDCHVIEEAAYDASCVEYAKAPLWQKIWESLGVLKKNAGNGTVITDKRNHELYLVDGLVVNQGPNYALAKRLQHWRAMLAHSEGHTVSSNVAPSTATLSVVHNAQFAAAYGGFHLFKPLEVLYQHTSSAIMAALLIHDVCNPAAFANGRNQTNLHNPLELFKYGSFHGGAHRCAYTIGTLGIPSAVRYYTDSNTKIIVIATALLIAWFSGSADQLLF